LAYRDSIAPFITFVLYYPQLWKADEKWKLHSTAESLKFWKHTVKALPCLEIESDVGSVTCFDLINSLLKPSKDKAIVLQKVLNLTS